jgi:hypothetical protein
LFLFLHRCSPFPLNRPSSMRSNFATPVSWMSDIQIMFPMYTRDDPILELFIWKIVNAIESSQGRKRTSTLVQRDGRPKKAWCRNETGIRSTLDSYASYVMNPAWIICAIDEKDNDTYYSSYPHIAW